MNQINPDKLLHSKWTAAEAKHKERHFIITKLLLADDKTISHCELQAVINKHVYVIDWQQLKDADCWMMGWK